MDTRVKYIPLDIYIHMYLRGEREREIVNSREPRLRPREGKLARSRLGLYPAVHRSITDKYRCHCAGNSRISSQPLLSPPDPISMLPAYTCLLDDIPVSMG